MRQVAAELNAIAASASRGETRAAWAYKRYR